MAQNRDAPAYQEYAASMMARIEYRLMSMEARGVLWSMRQECWVNGRLPSAPDQLARVLGCSVDLVERALPQLTAFLVHNDSHYRCPDLDDYRTHINDRRAKQSQGGKAGAAKTNDVRRGAATGKPPGKPRATRESLVQNSQDQHSKAQQSKVANLHDTWVSDYERASNGA